MATYIVLSAKTGPDKDAEAIFVRDGFSFLAAVFPLFWFMWHRMWLWALFVFAVLIAGGAGASSPVAGTLGGCVVLAISLLSGFEGRHLHVAHLSKSGFSVKSVLEAPDLETAEIAYFQDAPMVFSRANAKPVASKQAQGVGIFDSYGGI